MSIKTGFIFVAGLFMFCFSGCHSSPKLPPNAPLIDVPVLMTEDPPVGDTYDVGVKVCNRGPGILKTDVQVVGGQSEIMDSLGGITAPAGTFTWWSICRIKRNRLHPVRLRLSWQRGTETGAQTYTITPAQTNQTA